MATNLLFNCYGNLGAYLSLNRRFFSRKKWYLDVFSKEISTKRHVSWDQLPDDILETIARRLIASDRVRMSAVCKSWLSARLVPTGPPDEVPWLYVSSGEPCVTQIRFRSLSERRDYIFMLPGGLKGWCCGSSRGWLLVATGSRVDPDMFIWNPLSSATKKLPPLSTIPLFLEFMYEASGYDNSNCNAATFIHRVEVFPSSISVEEDCMIVAITCGFDLFDDFELAVCTTRQDETRWIVFKPQGCDSYEDIHFGNGVLYALAWGKNKIIGGETFTIPLTNAEVILKWIPYNIAEITDDEDVEKRTINSQFLVMSPDRKLLAVSPVSVLCEPDERYEERYIASPQTGAFEVHLIREEQNGIPLTSIGDQALFVAHTGCLSIPMKTGGDCIYLAVRDFLPEQERKTRVVCKNESSIFVAGFHLKQSRTWIEEPSITDTKIHFLSKFGWFTPKLAGQATEDLISFSNNVLQ